MKMLGWEGPFADALARIRAAEASHVRSMARIRAVNNALQFAITPVVSFATFAVYRCDVARHLLCKWDTKNLWLEHKGRGTMPCLT